jgi:pyruvate dehydrogenase E1 component alpha subunit/2-oxoisovalerate dehydrogenase E1 component alpha subunit
MSGEPPPTPLKYDDAALTSLLGPEWGAKALDGYRWMVLARTLDARMLALQRQGRVGFYGPATGQEAVSVAAALASSPDDWIVPGLREQLVALVRGHPVLAYIHHLFADMDDPAQGRQMPCHPTARDVQYVSMSSVVGTQISHGVGLAYAMKFRHAPGICFTFFGDGATSANDFHAGLNFAGVYQLPILFCCTNNRWAISVPVERQSHIAHLADKARAYGLPGQRVDGTDFIATLAALIDARRRIVEGGGPALLEFVLYRMTPHSSSDDPQRYQPPGWMDEARANDPMLRLEALLTERGVLTENARSELHSYADQQVRAAIATAEAVAPPPPETLLTDVFAEPSHPAGE